MIKSIVFDWGGVLIDRPTTGLLHYFAEYFNTTEEKFINIHKNRKILSIKEYFQKRFIGIKYARVYQKINQ
jgi:hypothetical protein